MRFVAPPRELIDPAIFAQPPFSAWNEFRDFLVGPDWPAVEDLNRIAGSASRHVFVVQTPALKSDGMHYEQRIAARGEIATRERNWHDLMNALVWLRFPALKSALNRRQVAEIERVGAKDRSRAQCAQTHFDEGGMFVAVRDPALMPLWDAHDWHGLFWRERDAWSDGRIEPAVFGHALLEHALVPHQLLVGKAMALQVPEAMTMDNAIEVAVAAIDTGTVLNDPQELRPLPLSGIPGWHRDSVREDFYSTAECFRPVRAGRHYPEPLSCVPAARS